MAPVSLATAVANLLFPAPIAQKLDDGKLSEHRRLIVLGSIRKAFKNTKAELVAEVVKASKASKARDEISEDEAERALGILCAVEHALQEDFELKPPGTGEDRDEFLATLATADRDEHGFEENDIRSSFDRFGVESDVDIPDYLHYAIDTFAWVKGADYAFEYPDALDEDSGAETPVVKDSVSETARADLLALGLNAVVEANDAAVAAGVDPLAQVLAEAERAAPGNTETAPRTTSSGSDRRHIVLPPLQPPGLSAEARADLEARTGRARVRAAELEDLEQISGLFLVMLLEVAKKPRKCRGKWLIKLSLLLQDKKMDEVAKHLLADFPADDDAWDAFGWSQVDQSTIAAALLRDDDTSILTSGHSVELNAYIDGQL